MESKSDEKEGETKRQSNRDNKGRMWMAQGVPSEGDKVRWDKQNLEVWSAQHTDTRQEFVCVCVCLCVNMCVNGSHYTDEGERRKSSSVQEKGKKGSTF